MYLQGHNKESGLGWVQAAIAIGTTIFGASQQNKALKAQVKGGKIALATVKEQRASALETGQLALASDRNKIIMAGIGAAAALGVGYMVSQRGKRR